MAATVIGKWGNSLGVRIPQSLAQEVHLAEGVAIDFEVLDGNLLMKPSQKRYYLLEEMLASITVENRHGEMDSGFAVGHEVW